MIVQFFDFILSIYPFTTAVLSMALAQGLKVVYSVIKEGKPDFKLLFSSGGMPSAHSAMVIGLTSAIGLKEGLSSSVFCMSLIFSFIVLYDAAGVRHSVGFQAGVLNRIIGHLSKKDALNIKKVSEYLGHSPFEVMIGALLGIGVALALY